MNITIENIKGKVPVTVLSTQGDLDASNYLALIAKARELCQQGIQHILLDMSDTPYMSSSGLVALHSMALLLRGIKPPDPEAGWSAIHAIGRDMNSGFDKNLKLFNPQLRVTQALEKTGLNRFFEIYRDRQAAIDSFEV